MKKNTEIFCTDYKPLYIYIINNNKTTEIMEIIITAEIEKDILKEMKKVSDRIEREMKISFDLRNYELIESDSRYLKEMKEALSKGVL